MTATVEINDRGPCIGEVKVRPGFSDLANSASCPTSDASLTWLTRQQRPCSPVFGLLNRLILLSLRDLCARNKPISTRVACANVTAAQHAKQYRGNSSNLDDLSARNWMAEQPNGVL
jgi:hypothetical protein